MVERNKRRRQSESSDDEISTSVEESQLVDPLSEAPSATATTAEETVADRARRTSEAAGLAHWTAPPTGHVPKVLGDRALSGQWDDPNSDGWASPDNPSWGGSDIGDAFSDPEPLAIDPTESTDGFGDRTRDPLADFAATPGSVTRDPLADFVTADPNPTDEISAVDTPPSLPSSPVEPEFEDEVDLTVEASPPELPVGRDRSSDAGVSPANLRPKHRSIAAEKRTVFDLPPSEQLGAARAPAEANEHNLTVSAEMIDTDDTVAIRDNPMTTSPAQSMPADVSLVGADSYPPKPTSPDVSIAPEPPASAGAASETLAAATYGDETDSTEVVETPPKAPASSETDPAPAAKGAGRNLVQATSVGVVLAAAVGVALWFGAAATAGLITLFGVLAIMEFYDAMRHAGLRPASLLGMIGVASIQIGVYFQGANAYPLVLALTVVFGVLWYLVGADRERPVLNLGLTMMGLLWVGGLAGFGVLIVTQPGGTGLLLAAIIITVASDTLAYIGGRSIGSTPFHSVSPNKTWEGTLIGFAGALFFGLAIGLLDVIPIFDGRVASTLVLAAVVGVLAPMGDLAESMMKRDLGVKDMGSLLPGHGGVMDRLDGLLFALPGAYYVGLLFNLF